MRRILTIDEGNTSTKFALWEGDRLVGMYADRLPEPMGTVDGVIVSSVRKNSSEKERFRALSGRFIDLSALTPMPIAIGYTTPATLGADRMAAAAGAFALADGAPVLTVDIGTAVTYDFITADGCFVGGNIAPGIDLRLKSLNAFTEALPRISADGPAPLLGKDTPGAMRSGAVRGVAAEVEYYRSTLAKEHPLLKLILTGGGASTVAPYISSPYILEPNLVMIGLKRIFDYNEAT